MISDDLICESALFFPEKRLLWLETNEHTLFPNEYYEIINVDEKHIIRRIKGANTPLRVRTGRDYLVVTKSFDKKEVRIFSESGRTLHLIEMEAEDLVDAVAIHPDGRRFILLKHNEEDEENLFCLSIQVWPDPENKFRSISIKGSNGEMKHNACTALATGKVFINFYGDNGRMLMVFKTDEKKLKRLYSMPIPKNVHFTTDEFSKNVAAIQISPRQCRVSILSGEKPSFFPHPDILTKDWLPEFHSSHWYCHEVKGPIKAQSMALLLKTENIGNTARTRDMVRAREFESPGELLAFILALEKGYHHGSMERVKELKAMMQENFPEHYYARIQIAHEAASRNEWYRVIATLTPVRRKVIDDDGSARHISHLLGMAFFAGGDPDKALDIWLEGRKYSDGKCDLEPYIDYARATIKRMKNKNRPGRMPEKPGMERFLWFYEIICDYRKKERWPDVIKTIENNEANIYPGVMIRTWLAEAYLHLDFGIKDIHTPLKILTLAKYVDNIDGNRDSRHTPILPPYFDALPENLISKIVRKAFDWLEGFRV